MTYAKILTALADPTRRAIVTALHQGPQNVATLAHSLPVSRPAVSQHLKVLSDAGLLTSRQVGARRIYALAPQGPRALHSYLDQMWGDALAAFGDYIQKEQHID
jgi:DNA-binding transcriptional ArsR family regulator